jgi:hypothetical protein
MSEYHQVIDEVAPSTLREEQTSIELMFAISAAAAPFVAEGQPNKQPSPQTFMNYTPEINVGDDAEPMEKEEDAVASIVEQLVTTTAEAEARPSSAHAPPPPPEEAAAETSQQQEQQQPNPLSPMKNINNPAVILESLRSQIPANILSTYSSPLEVSPEDAAAAQERSALYHEELARQKTIVRAKPDIKAVKSLQSDYPEWPVWPRQHGHPPGIKPGDAFSGRGELWLTGAHQQYFRGIDSAGKTPAYAIVLSGEYEDDDDHGDYLHYTGEGGRAEGGVRQAKDQSFDSHGNAALKRNCEQGVPVRVMRGAKSPEGEISYTYDGLYCVTSAELMPGKSGTLVCKFAMVGIPGHYKACRKVTFLAVRGFKSIQLAGRDYIIPGERKSSRTRAPKKSKAAAAAAAASASAPKRKRTKVKRNSDGMLIIPEPGPANREEYLAEIRDRQGLLLDDLTAGVEPWPIPVFNETGDGAMLPTDLQYIK